ncbi:type II secretion system protein [Massilia sp. TS11]|uniref:type II secretion system protein n=1 Tax=Massilia sp. TS11 TaxID=2908003 RepID=UPI001EDBFE5F|nr:type II secretion system protein [Massilia sp. TS11]MCG2584754.1 type II secretion system GspH family protein [Massilia sp. TS11]
MRLSLRSRQSGFTLIDLLIVMLLLGTLMATIWSKAVNIRQDAERAQLMATMAAIRVSADLIHQKWRLNGGNYVVQEGRQIPVTEYGWPSAQYWDIPVWGADVSMFPVFFHGGYGGTTYHFGDRYCGFTYNERDGSVTLYGNQC